jgi:hypothetical protein
MSKVIWKYPLEVRDSNVIEMPYDAKILCVQTQNNIPCIWAIVNKDAYLENRFFRIVGTGQPFQKEFLVYRNYIGTFQLDNGSLVFHLFEDK